MNWAIVAAFFALPLAVFGMLEGTAAWRRRREQARAQRSKQRPGITVDR